MSGPEGAFRLDVGADGLATLTFDAPGRSVNVFSRPVLEELVTVANELGHRHDIRALALRSGKPKGFIAGADLDLIAELDDPAEAERGARVGQEIMSAWEGLPFPTVAAIRGTCVGGGTELALASSWIVTSDRQDTRIGLPEVRIGILPGWGGCTRLPRRLGVPEALDLILQGRLVRPKKALRLGLVDAVLPDPTFDAGLRTFMEKIADRDTADRGAGGGGMKHVLIGGNPLGRKIVFDQARKKTMEATKGHYPAPLRAIEVVRIGLEEGPEAGFAAEVRAIGELATSRTCKNLIHLFRANEKATKGELPEAADVASAAVIGAGVMGGGIAHLLADRGIQVRLKDIAPAGLATGMAHAAKRFRRQVERKRLSEVEAERRMALLRPTLDTAGLGRCEVAIEAVVERLDVKQAVFEELDEALSDAAVLASNTSSLDVDAIGGRVADPSRMVGMHFFNPVHRMPLVEIVRGEKTGSRTVATVTALARRLGKTPVVVRSTPGFLVNRLLGFYMVEALWLVDDGFAVETIDQAMEAWGMPMGPLALLDEVGLDVGTKVSEILAAAFDPRLPAPRWADRLPSPDRLGSKTGAGIYDYEQGRRDRPDPSIYGRLGLPDPTRAPEARLVDRLVLRMVDEAARCLDEEVVRTAAELDLAMIMGTGFPPFRGGLCRWADDLGVSRIVDELDRLAAAVGDRFAPGDALRAAARDGGFYSKFGTD